MQSGFAGSKMGSSATSMRASGLPLSALRNCSSTRTWRVLRLEMAGG